MRSDGLGIQERTVLGGLDGLEGHARTDSMVAPQRQGIINLRLATMPLSSLLQNGHCKSTEVPILTPRRILMRFEV